MNALALVLSLAAVVLAPPAQAQIETAQVSGGAVRGTAADGIAVFKGIPYAAPPLGSLRWHAPQPVVPWQGERAAAAFGNVCMQNPGMLAFFGDTTPMSEDCLTLNVWTPAKAPADKLPVMVWIYGGGFQGGASSLPLFDGTAFAKRGVIFVSMNYRTGALGFLAHPELTREAGRGSGNYGLRDILASLHWVQDNIARFGGDPGNVTLFGQSAGGEAVGMLAASPPAKGLFARMISQSGGNMKPAHRADTDFSLNQQRLPDAEAHSVDYLAKLGAKDIAAARALPAAAVVAKMGEAHGPFWPDFDGEVQAGDPMELFAAGRFVDVPMLAGSNSDEGVIAVRDPVTPASFEAFARERFGAMAEVILAAYPHATDAEARGSQADIFRDNEFAWSTYQWLRMAAVKGRAPLWGYYFDRRTERSPRGAGHGAEVGFVFGRGGRPGETPTAADMALSDQLMSYWINFAKTGDPNGPGLPLWPRFRAGEEQIMALGDTTGPIPVPNKPMLDALSAYYEWRKRGD